MIVFSVVLVFLKIRIITFVYLKNGVVFSSSRIHREFHQTSNRFFSTVRFFKIRLNVTRLLRGCFVYWVQNTSCVGQTQFVIFQDDEIQLKNNMKNQDFINSVQVIYLELKKISNLFITLSSVLFYKIQSVVFRLRLIKKRSRQQKFNKV